MNKKPVLGLDFVGTISDFPQFFEILTNLWEGTVIVISHVDSPDDLIPYLTDFKIRYDKIIAVPVDKTKADIIVQEEVDFYFDDRASNHKEIPAKVASFLVRGMGNFDYGEKLWKMERKWQERRYPSN